MHSNKDSGRRGVQRERCPLHGAMVGSVGRLQLLRGWASASERAREQQAAARVWFKFPGSKAGLLCHGMSPVRSRGGSTTIKLRVGIIFVFQPPLYVCPGSCASSHDLVRGPALARGSAGQVAFGAVRVGGEALPRVSWVESPMRCLGCVCEGGLSGWRCRQGEGIGREGRRRRGR